jgi:hypothetical protein
VGGPRLRAGAVGRGEGMGDVGAAGRLSGGAARRGGPPVRRARARLELGLRPLQLERRLRSGARRGGALALLCCKVALLTGREPLSGLRRRRRRCATLMLRSTTAEPSRPASAAVASATTSQPPLRQAWLGPSTVGPPTCRSQRCGTHCENETRTRQTIVVKNEASSAKVL